MTLRIRNLQANAFGSIDLEVEHPVFGWIPFTAAEDDPEPLGRELFALASSGQAGPVAPYVPPPPPPPPPAVPEPTLADVKQLKLAEIAAWRYAREVGGVTLNGMNVQTDRESQATISGAYSSLKDGFITSVDWKLADGSFVTLGLAEITAIAQAVAAHVQQSFTLEKGYALQVNTAASIEEVQAIVLP